MKAVYLLPCTCGQKVRVDAGQAGAKVPCTCGQQLTVPTFRALRELEQEVPVASAPVRGGATNDWDAIRGILFSVGLLVLLVSAVLVSYHTYMYLQFWDGGETWKQAHYLDEDTPFPKDRKTLDVPYALSPAYKDLFDDVLAYAREQIRDGATGARGRVRWWSALALLRAMASSPRAAAATLSRRAANADLADPAEVDALGKAGVLDASDDDTLESLDTTPGALIDDEAGSYHPST